MLHLKYFKIIIELFEDLYNFKIILTDLTILTKEKIKNNYL